MYELRVVGTYRHFQAKTSETDVTTLSMSTGHSGATRISFSEGFVFWERAPRYYGPLFLLKSNRT